MVEEKKQSFLGQLTGLMDRFAGDKVIFLIAMFLMLISVISVFSSTPLLAIAFRADFQSAPFSIKYFRTFKSPLSIAETTGVLGG